MDTTLHDDLVERLQYFDGHSDTLGLFADAGFLARAAAAVAAPFRAEPVEKVAGIEARGFVLAGVVAAELGAGFVGIRRPGSIHPGPKVELTAPPDWRGLETTLRLQRHVVAPGDRVLVVDDWAQTGSKAITARRLIESCGARMPGCPCLSTSCRLSCGPSLRRLQHSRSRTSSAARTTPSHFRIAPVPVAKVGWSAHCARVART